MPHKKTTEILPCMLCGTSFYGTNWGGGMVSKTCSAFCLDIVKRAQRATLRRPGALSATWKGGMPTWTCRHCQGSFRAYRIGGGKDRQFCSWQCSNEAHRKTVFDMRHRLMYEHELIDRLTGRGYRCLRSAGSRGPADLFAFNADHVRIIQVKSTINFGRKGNVSMFRRAIADLTDLCTPAQHCTRELWVRVLRRGWWYLVVDDFPEDRVEQHRLLSDLSCWVEG